MSLQLLEYPGFQWENLGVVIPACLENLVQWMETIEFDSFENLIFDIYFIYKLE